MDFNVVLPTHINKEFQRIVTNSTVAETGKHSLVPISNKIKHANLHMSLDLVPTPYDPKFKPFRTLAWSTR